MDSCAVPWTSFGAPNGFVRAYTYLGSEIRDYEASAGSDPSNGGSAVNPNSIDISSASPQSAPGPESSVAFGYYDGGTVWSAGDPATLADDVLFFRIRIGANPRDNSLVGFDAYHWNVLFDLDADGYKDYWIDIEGSYANNGNPDRVQVLHDPAHTQLIASADASRVAEFSARASVDAASCGGAGTSHTRTYPVNDGSNDWMIDLQVPMAAFTDRSGNQLLYPDTPVAFVFTTGASNQDPLQKDHMMDLDYTGPNQPVTFGDLVTPSGAPSIEFTSPALQPAVYYLLDGEVFVLVTDFLANTDPARAECVDATVADPVSGDDEPLRLCETGPSTGIFTNRGGLGAVTLPRDPVIPSTEGWLIGLRATTRTVAARWELVYEAIGFGQWRVRYSLDDGASWTTLPDRALRGAPYTASVGGVPQVSFTVEQSGPDSGDTIAFATTAGEPLFTTAAASEDEDGFVTTDSGRTLYVSYTNAAHHTVTDSIPVLGPCGATVEFTRSNGLVTTDFDIAATTTASDRLYVTVTSPSANTDPASVQTVSVTVTSTRPGGDVQVLILTETGVDTGVFRNGTGLGTVIASAAFPVTPGNNRWEDVDRGEVTATYTFQCGGSPLTASRTATLFSTPSGGRVEFTNGAGTTDETLYRPGSLVWVQVADATVASSCVSPPYLAGTVRVTVRSSAGDAETLVLYETAPGSGLYRNQLQDLVTSAGSPEVTSATATFVAGQVLAIATGPDAGLYAVVAVAGSTATLDRPLTAARTGIAFAIAPLRAQTWDGASATGDSVLEGAHEGLLTVEYADCSDGDAVATNNLKTDVATYNAPPLVVNRVLFAPDSPLPTDDPPTGKCQQEMVEVYNQTAGEVNATGFVLRDEDLELDYTVPQLGGADVVLPPGGRLVVSFGGYFPDFQAGSTFYLFTGAMNPDDTLPNWLGGPGDPDPADQVMLLDASGDVVDYVGWSSTASPSVDFLGDDAAAVTARVWQDDAYRTTSSLQAGEALARTTDGVDTNVPGDWSLFPDSTCEAMITAYAATRATVRGLRVDPSGRVEFATGTQRGSRSFRVLAVEDPRRGARGVPLHDRPVPAVVSDSLTPVFYRVETAPVTTPFVAIEETDVSGATRTMGPFAVGDPALEARLRRVEAQLDRAGVRDDLGPRVATGLAGLRLMGDLARPQRRPRGSAPAPFPRPVAAGGVKVLVRDAGTVEIPLATLRAHGAPHDLRALSVTAMGDRVPFRVGPQSLLFRVRPLATDTADRGAYVVSWSGSPPRAVPLTRSGDAPWPGYTRVEKSTTWVPSLPREADPWQWDLLLTGFGSWPYAWWGEEIARFDLPGYRAPRGLVRVVLRLVGFTAHEHTVSARVNGRAVGAVTFTGKGPFLLSGALPPEALRPEGNRLELDYEADVSDPAAEYGMVYLDHLDVGIAPEPATAPARYELRPWDPVALPSRGDYLIVTHADFAGAARRIARAKAEEGLQPVVVDVERAYDAFSGGVPEPNAVAALVRGFAARGGRYVLLIGDDTFDPRDLAGTGAVSFVPSAMRFDEVWGRVPSENAYADVDGDGRPEVAIGRLPCRTPEEAALLAAKIESQGEVLASTAGRHVVAVDNSGPGDPPFRKDAEAIPLPGATSLEWADLGDGAAAARQALHAGLAAGAQVTHYFGHGGPEEWADESLLTAADVALLPAAAPTVLFTWACQSQWYLNLWGPSVNEALLLAPRGGALASFGPAGITTPRQQRPLARGVYERFLAGGMTLGDAVREAKAEALATDPTVLPAVDGFNLLGDPALKLPAVR
ncbi:MAG TPA: C25 family cysteine peptidase [Vicinamibacteria bacterium]